MTKIAEHVGVSQTTAIKWLTKQVSSAGTRGGEMMPKQTKTYSRPLDTDYKFDSWFVENYPKLSDNLDQIDKENFVKTLRWAFAAGATSMLEEVKERGLLKETTKIDALNKNDRNNQ